MSEQSTRCWSLLDWRYLATYAVEGSEGVEPLSAAEGLVYYVPGAVVWKGRRIAASDFFLSTYGVVASRRVVDDAELNLPSEPNYIHRTNTYTTRRRPA